MSGITQLCENGSEKNNLIFIGYMGAGKTSVGGACARLTGAPLLDTDELIEKKMNKTVSEIFDESGEEAFRAMETDTLRELMDECDHSVIAVGGGLPLREENRKLLKRLGTVIFLRAERDTVLDRLKGDTTRPNLRGGNLAEKADKMLALRNPIYLDSAHWAIDTDERTPEEIAREAVKIAGWL